MSAPASRLAGGATSITPRTRARAGSLSPGSPMRAGGDMPFSSETEYSATYKRAAPLVSAAKSSKRGNASQALWLSIGADKYSTETRHAYPGSAPPPPAPRPVPKWEPNTLPFHDRTVYRESFSGVTGGKPEIYRPRQQTSTL